MKKTYWPLSHIIILPIIFVVIPLVVLYSIKDQIIAGFPNNYNLLVNICLSYFGGLLIASPGFIYLFLYIKEIRIDNTFVSGFVDVTDGRVLCHLCGSVKTITKFFLCQKRELKEYVPNAQPTKAIVLYFSNGKVGFLNVHGFTKKQIQKIMHHLDSVASIEEYAALIDRSPDVDAMIEFSEDISLPAEIGCRLEHAVGDTVLWGMHKYYSVTEVLPGGRNKGNITFDLSKAYSLHINVGDKIEIRENGRAVGTATVTEIFNEKLK